MRPRHPAMLERLKEIVDVMEDVGIPVVANGDCWSASDVDRIQKLTGVTSIMIARGAEANPSCFRPDGLLDPATVIIPRYLRLAVATDNHISNSKYCLQSMDLAASPLSRQPGSGNPKSIRAELSRRIPTSKTYEQLFELFGMQIEEVDEARRTTVEEIVPDLVRRLLHTDTDTDTDAPPDDNEEKDGGEKGITASLVRLDGDGIKAHRGMVESRDRTTMQHEVVTSSPIVV